MAHNPTPKFEVSITYSTVTPESAVELRALDSDFEDTGFVVEPESATLEDIVSYAQSYGIGPRTPGDWTDWWESDWTTTDYSTGEEIQHSLHVKKLGAPGRRLDERTFDRINKILGGTAYRAKNPRRKKTSKKRATSVRSLVARALK